MPPEQQAELAKLQTEGAQLSAKFSQNVLDATDAFALYFDDAAPLAGIPEDSLAMFAAAAQNEGKTGYKIGLQIPHYLAVIQYADNRDLRKQIYRAYVTRASELSDDGKFDNTANIDRTLKNALQTAKLLGFKNYAELSLFTKMADSPEQVLTFLHDLARRAKPYAEKDLAEVKAFAREHLNLADPQPWDLSYASEKLREAKYAFSETEVKKYFPVGKVLAGLFAQIKKLYHRRSFDHRFVAGETMRCRSLRSQQRLAHHPTRLRASVRIRELRHTILPHDQGRQRSERRDRGQRASSTKHLLNRCACVHPHGVDDGNPFMCRFAQNERQLRSSQHNRVDILVCLHPFHDAEQSVPCFR